MSLVRILYVESQRAVTTTVRQLLQLEGWAVESCRDASEAESRLHGAEATYDLVIMSAEAPDCGEAVSALLGLLASARVRGVPILTLAADACRDLLLGAGADAFLSKPAGIRDLVPTVESLLNRPRTAAQTN